MRLLILFCFTIISFQTIYSNSIDSSSVSFTAKLYCEIENNGLFDKIDYSYIDTNYAFTYIKNSFGFDSSLVKFIKIVNINSSKKEEFYLAYIVGFKLLLRLEGFHENDFRRFMWFYESIADPIRNKPYRNCKKFSKKHYVKGVNLYALYKEWKRIKKSRYYFISSHEEYNWLR
jgi:hypothetical protein